MAVRLVPAALVFALILAFSGRPALGASFTVDSTTDAVDANPGDGICADSEGKCTLRAAVMETNALPSADEITVPAGTYTLTKPPLVGGPPSASHGDLDVRSDLTITGAGVDGTVVDGGGLDRIFWVHPSGGGTVDARISRLTMRNGHSFAQGGAILNWGTLTLSDVVVTGSSAERGGGIANETGDLTLVDSTIAANSSSSSGGGIYNEALLTIDRSTIQRNQALFGGGLANPGSDVVPGGFFGTATIVNSTFTLNSGGIASGGSLTLTNVTIGYNDGTGLEIGPFGSATLANTIIGFNSHEEVGEHGSTFTGSDCEGGPGPFSLGHNLASDGSCALTGPGDLRYAYPGIMGPADNGGPTQTLALFQLYCYDYSDVCDGPSHAIDAGDDARCPSTDQRGMPRPFDGDGDGVAVCDIGAYERQDGPRRCQVGCNWVASGETPTPTPPPTPAAFPPTGGAPGNEGRGVGGAAVAALAAALIVVGLAALRRRIGRQQL